MDISGSAARLLNCYYEPIRAVFNGMEVLDDGTIYVATNGYSEPGLHQPLPYGSFAYPYLREVTVHE